MQKQAQKTSAKSKIKKQAQKQAQKTSAKSKCKKQDQKASAKASAKSKHKKQVQTIYKDRPAPICYNLKSNDSQPER